MPPQNFIRNDMDSFPRLVEENLSMLEETYEGTVLHLATQLGSEVYAKKIIEHCPSLVSTTNSKGDTPLHLAASLGYTSILIWMLESIELHKTLEDPKPAEMMNKAGLTPLHFAAMKGSVEILKEFLLRVPSSFCSVTREKKKETVFHIAARHKNNEAFIFMAESVNLGQLLYQLDVEGNTVLHVAASVGSIALVKYITEGRKIEVTTKNKKGFVAFDLLNKYDENFFELSPVLMCGPPSPREMGKFVDQVADDLKKLKKEMILRVQSRDTPNENIDTQSVSLQSGRDTLAIIAVLIASVTFTCGINPPGGVYQEGLSIGKSTAGTTLAFMIFSSNSIALFTSVSMVILLVGIMPYSDLLLKKTLVIAYWMMWVAVAAMESAYVSAAWITLPRSGQNKWLLYAILAIASLTLGGMFVFLWFKLAKLVLRQKYFEFKVLRLLSKLRQNAFVGIHFV